MLETLRHDSVLELRLARPPVNALDPTLVAKLRQAFIEAPAQGARCVILSGNKGLFSAGLDVPTLLTLDRSGMVAFWREFQGLLGAIARCAVPTVAAITGHSPAGGAVLSIFCDYRIMARGAYRIGLNEVQVGLSVPSTIQYAFKRLLGAHRADRLMMQGAIVEAEEAHRIGLVDELVDVDHVVAHAIDWGKHIVALPYEAMSETRRLARADLHAAVDEGERAPNALFLERWFSAEAQSTLRALVAKLKSKG
jgi:enoyl-CoA hydratase/carnithine racemase